MSLIDVLLLTALPASGKSEVRAYLKSLTPEQCRDQMHLGPTVQLDDYPYVHMMRRISQELGKLGQEKVFFESDESLMTEPRDWGTLIQLLNEDFDDMVNRRRPEPASAGEWLLDRFDEARRKVGIRPALGQLEPAARLALVAKIEAEAKDLLEKKNAEIPDSLHGKTIVIELARGGPDGATLPLPSPLGYRYSLAAFSKQILERASVLYVWVTPEESRRKNIARTDPNDPGSILHHGVPMVVMLGDYGCDDMDWLIHNSDRPDTVKLEAYGRQWHLPVARFDNRVDKTTFVRKPRAEWKPEEIAALHNGLAEALGRVVAAAKNAI
jgi:hypothetical protein